MPNVTKPDLHKMPGAWALSADGNKKLVALAEKAARVLESKGYTVLEAYVKLTERIPSRNGDHATSSASVPAVASPQLAIIAEAKNVSTYPNANPLSDCGFEIGGVMTAKGGFSHQIYKPGTWVSLGPNQKAFVSNRTFPRNRLRAEVLV